MGTLVARCRIDEVVYVFGPQNEQVGNVIDESEIAVVSDNVRDLYTE